MAEFCQMLPLRRIGLAVVPMLYDPELAVKEVEWAHDNGLKGILFPALMGDHDPYNHPKYHPVWQACEERGMVVHNHSGPSPDYNFELRGAMGVFEKFPRLKYCITEVSEFWVPSMLEMMRSEERRVGK